MAEARVADDSLLRLAKAELHVHLDGSLRPATMLELARERGVDLPADDTESLAAYMLVSNAASLEDYLERFHLTLAVMQDAEAIERIAYELAEDHASENVRYVEARFAPVLNTRSGLSGEAVLDAALAGLKRAEADFAVHTAIIVCALRSLPPGSSLQMAELAVAYKGRGVCAFDVAGAEAGFPVRTHLEALQTAAEAALPITIHAGEGFGAVSIRQAVELGRAGRIGHGTRLLEDPELLAQVRDAGIPLEVCLTSNVQTRVARSYAEHPARLYFDEGLRICLCTDNRLMSGVTLTREYEHARDDVGFSYEELVTVARNGFEAAYAPEALKAALVEGMGDGWEQMG
jgi:adenosine deaminase